MVSKYVCKYVVWVPVVVETSIQQKKATVDCEKKKKKKWWDSVEKAYKSTLLILVNYSISLYSLSLLFLCWDIKMSNHPLPNDGEG